MKSRIGRSKEFTAFRSEVPRQKCNVEGKDWTYFQFGPTKMAPLICLHGTSGTAETFFCQVMTLGSKGYHVIAAQWPDYWDHGKWVDGFYKFLATINIKKCHLLGVSLGGFMALHFAGRYPDRVQSLILCNSFVDTRPFHQPSAWSTMLGYMPEFYLKKYILDSFPKGNLPGPHADAVDFVVEQLETLTRKDLGSRLSLNCLPSSVAKYIKSIKEKHPMTILDTVDDVVLPEIMRERLYKAFPNAKQAYIKSGGDFPFLSSHMEVSMHIQVHLRGIEVFPGGVDAKEYAKKSGIEIKEEKAQKKKEAVKKVVKKAVKKVLTEKEKEALRRKKEEELRRKLLYLAGRGGEKGKGRRNRILAGLVDKSDEDADNLFKDKSKKHQEKEGALFVEDTGDAETGEADPFS
eukprot:jgi/Bigna1/128353/aug1.6_g3061